MRRVERRGDTSIGGNRTGITNIMSNSCLLPHGPYTFSLQEPEPTEELVDAVEALVESAEPVADGAEAAAETAAPIEEAAPAANGTDASPLEDVHLMPV